MTTATAKGGASGSYTWRVVDDDPDAGTWLLQVFNPGTVAAWDLSGDDDCPVVRKGRDVTNRSYRRFMPQATDVAYEGAGYQIARRRNDAAVAALGRIGGYVPGPDVPDIATVGLAAEAELAMRLAGSTSLAYQVTPDRAQGAAVPLVDYLPGYTILVEDEPLISLSAHVVDAIRYRFGKGPDAYEVHFDTESFVGDEAVSEGVRRLLAVFKGVRPEAAAQLRIGGSGVIPWLVAASDSPEPWKSVAGYVCTGTASNPIDAATLQTAIDAVDTGDGYAGEVWLAPGTYQLQYPADGSPVIDGAVGAATGVRLVGKGSRYGATINVRGSATTNQVVFYQLDAGGSNLFVNDLNNGSPSILWQITSPDAWFEDVAFFVNGRAIVSGSGSIHIHRSQIEVYDIYPAISVEVGGTSSRVAIRDCTIVALDKAIELTNAFISTGVVVTHPIIDGNLIIAVQAVGMSANTRTLSGVHITNNHMESSDLVFDTIRPMIALTDVVDAVIAGNLLVGSFQFDGSCGDGIVLTDVSDSQVYGNILRDMGSEPLGTYDAIRLAGDSNRNHVHDNVVVPLAGSTRYGINVSASTCDDNVVADNMLGAAADYGTSAYNDAGTGTVTARDGNGQFTT